MKRMLRVAACVGLVAAESSLVLAQEASNASQPMVFVTGVGRVFVAPDQAVVRLGATVQREKAAEAQRDLDAIMRAAVRSIGELGIPAERFRTASVSLAPVYFEPADLATQGSSEEVRGRVEPRVVGYRATNILHVTVEDLALLGGVVDAGIAAGINEIQGVSFELANDLPYRVTALERAVDAARQKARVAAGALGVRLADPIEVRERSVGVPYQLDAAFSSREVAPQLQPGEIAIEVAVDATFGLAIGATSADN